MGKTASVVPIFLVAFTGVISDQTYRKTRDFLDRGSASRPAFAPAPK